MKKSGLDACDFNVILDAEHENHDHDMAYLHGDGAEVHDHPHDHEHHHDHEHAHSHDHDHTEEHHHHHEHRGLPEILAIIRSGGLTPSKSAGGADFPDSCRSGSKAHGVPLDQVHFHEVGAVDSIVDIVSAAVCLDNLAPDEVIVTGLSEEAALSDASTA